MKNFSVSLIRPAIHAAAWCVLMLALVVAPAAAAHQPTDVIRAGTTRAAEIMKTEQLPNPAALDASDLTRLIEIARDFFDFDEMARRVLGRHWRDQEPEKLEEFIYLFNRLIYISYHDKVEYFSGNEVEFRGEEIDGRYATVLTRTPYRDDYVNVKFRLKMRNGDWRVYDVVVEGISLIHNYRAQFNSILSRESFDDLLARLKEKMN